MFSPDFAGIFLEHISCATTWFLFDAKSINNDDDDVKAFVWVLKIFHQDVNTGTTDILESYIDIKKLKKQGSGFSLVIYMSI